MADSDLADLRKQCMDELYLCVANVSKYLDSEKDDEFDNLKTCVQGYCELEAMQGFQTQALVKAKREINVTTLNQLDKKYSTYLNNMLEQKKIKVDHHPFMVKFEKIRRTQQVTTNTLDQSDIAITETQETYRDPITKKPIQDPVRNTMCGHIYEKSAILVHIKRKNAKCPVAGCGNLEPVMVEHLLPDDELRLQMTEPPPATPSRNMPHLDLITDYGSE